MVDDFRQTIAGWSGSNFLEVVGSGRDRPSRSEAITSRLYSISLARISGRGTAARGLGVDQGHQRIGGIATPGSVISWMPYGIVRNYVTLPPEVYQCSPRLPYLCPVGDYTLAIIVRNGEPESNPNEKGSHCRDEMLLFQPPNADLNSRSNRKKQH